MAVQPDARIESAIDTAQNTAYGAIDTVRKALIGAGPEAHASMKALTDRAVMLSGTASSVRDYITTLRADESQPKDYRDKMAAQIHRAAEERLREDRDHLVKTLMPHLEHTLSEASLPLPNKDASAEGLRRQEVMNLVSGTTGPHLMGAMLDNLGKNPAWDSTMLSDFGASLFTQGGLTAHDWSQFRKAAAAKLMSNTNGSEKMLANRRALAAMYQSKLGGHIDGLGAIARHRLGDL